MIHIASDDKELELMGAKLTFLRTFPLCEIDNEYIQHICRQYRSKKADLLKCLVNLRAHDDYLNNWVTNNRMCNVFYCRE